MRIQNSWIAIALLVVGVGGYLAYRLGRPASDRADVIRVSGNIELTEVAIAFQSPGRLAELLADEGDEVHRGDIIARLDTDELEEQVERARAVLAIAESRLRELESSITLRNEQIAGETMRAQAELDRALAALEELRAGVRPQEIEAAEAMVASAQSEFSRAESDWERAQDLHEDEDISTAQFDESRARYEVASARLRETQQRLALLQEGARREDVQAAEADVARTRANMRLAQAGLLEVARMREETGSREAEIRQAEAEVAIAETRLSNAVATSPVDGVVLVKAAETGEVLPTGMPVVTIGDLSRPWLRAYIGETDLGRVRLGAEVPVRTDSFPGKTYAGRVSFISSEAEFTPNQIQTDQERVRLVYRIKIDIENPNGELKSNMPADADISLVPAG